MNEEVIKEFLNFLLSQGISQPRILKYEYTLRSLSKFLKKDFRKVTKEDLVNFFAKLEANKIKPEGKEAYSDETKRDFRIITKRFWKWLKNCDEGYPDEVKWIKTTPNKKLEHVIRTKDVLTEEEVYKMVDTATHVRDKAIISMLFETGSRIGEIRKLKLKDIVFDDKGYNFVTNGKTGDVYKRVMNPKAVELLKTWIEKHPLKDNPEAPLWVTLPRARRGIKQMDYAGFNKMLKEVATIAGITKRVNPHAFRHARITDLRIRKKVPDAIIEMLVGWRPGSKQFKIYQHGKSEDIDNALSRVYVPTKEQLVEKALANIKIKKPELFKALVDFVRNELRES